jgi:hypothetical protein
MICNDVFFIQYDGDSHPENEKYGFLGGFNLKIVIYTKFHS